MQTVTEERVSAPKTPATGKLSVALLDVQTRKTAINKTMAGGYGSASTYGGNENVLVKALTEVKRATVKIPLVELAYLARIFKDQGHAVKIEYGSTMPDADLYIIYSSLVEFEAEIRMAAEIKKRNPKAKVGFIGIFPAVTPELLSPHADFVIAGEPEGFFLRFDGNLDALTGVIHPPKLDHPDDLPYPDWSGFPMKKFLHMPFFGFKTLFPVLTSRGCPFSCKYYCPYPLITGSKVRYRSPENVVGEFEYLVKTYGAKAMLIRDAIFTVNRKFAEAVCKGIMDKKLNIRWACETHPTCLDEPLLDLMHRSGCRAITMGIESRTAEVIKQTHRQDTQEVHLRKIVSHAEKIGIKVMAQYILGALSDTRESILSTIKYAAAFNTSFAQFNVSTPYPGTEYYEALKDRLITKDWQRYDLYTLVFDHPNFSYDEFERLKKKAYNSYYYRPKWIATKLIKNLLHDTFDRC